MACDNSCLCKRKIVFLTLEPTGPAVLWWTKEKDLLPHQMRSQSMIRSQMSFHRDRMSSITCNNGTYWWRCKWKGDGLKLAFGHCAANCLFQKVAQSMDHFVLFGQMGTGKVGKSCLCMCVTAALYCMLMHLLLCVDSLWACLLYSGKGSIKLKHILTQVIWSLTKVLELCRDWLYFNMRQSTVSFLANLKVFIIFVI